MKPEAARKILEEFENIERGYVQTALPEQTWIEEVTPNGDQVFFKIDEISPSAKDSQRTPGEYIVVVSNHTQVRETLSSVAIAGYLVSQRPENIEINDTDPKLQLISHRLIIPNQLESVFIDYNPQS